MEEAQHSSSNSFVKRQQERLSAKGGRNPRIEEKDMEFDAEMMNNGMHAQELARELTAGLDKEAFPVK